MVTSCLEPAPATHQIGRLDVAMHDAFFVCGLQALGGLGADSKSVLERERPGLDLLVESLPFQEGHGNERLAVDLADFIDVADVGMIQGG